MTEGIAVMLEKPLGTAGKVAGRALGPPINLGLTAVGRTIGLARGTARSVFRMLPGPGPDRAEPTPWPPDPSPADQTDLADIADRAEQATDRDAAAGAEKPGSAAPSGSPDESPTEGAEDVITPVGTPGADVAHNPDTTDTDLQQPGTEPLMDPSTTKAVASEAETLRRAADPEKG